MSNSPRKNIRFHSDENTILRFDIGNHEVDGLGINESQGGCSGVFLVHEDITVNRMCMIKVGKLDPLSARICWVTKIDDEIVKVGFEYQE